MADMVYAHPGDVVHFRCDHCNEVYRQTVQPRRDLERAMRRLKEQDDVPYAMTLLDEAYEALCGIAEYLTAVETSGQKSGQKAEGGS